MNPLNLPVVVTDSASQLVQDEVKQLNIRVIPLEISINGKVYRDGLDINPEDLYAKMRAEKLDVKTSAPSVGKFYQTFLDIIEQGSDEILCITLSNKLSSTYNSALLAANMIHAELAKKRVVVFDSLTAAVAQGFLALEAANQLLVGKSLDTVIQFLTVARQRTGLIAAIESLKYLAQGGRIGKASYLVGNTLKIMPILTVNQEGIVAPIAKVRRKDSIIPNIISIFIQHLKGAKKVHLSVMHADKWEEANSLQQALISQGLPKSIPIEPFTPVMGAHTGPGLYGLGYYYE
ncbi:MAG TPA: DegV family protein [Bacteroidales bacterium]|nr:DegV family protein [Bacteroidales bacterium]